jgi:hypothetical protein
LAGFNIGAKQEVMLREELLSALVRNPAELKVNLLPCGKGLADLGLEWPRSCNSKAPSWMGPQSLQGIGEKI